LTLAKLHKMFYASQLEAGARLDEWLVELERIRVLMEQMNSMMTDAQFMVHVMNNLTPDYDLVVDIHSRKIVAASNPLTIEDLQEELDLRCEVLADRKPGHKNKSHQNNTEDTALYAGGKFKGKCHHCGKFGNETPDCWIKDPSKKVIRNPNQN
jgi:hypothetical protein